MMGWGVGLSVQLLFRLKLCYYILTLVFSCSLCKKRKKELNDNISDLSNRVTEACLFSDNSGATTLPPIQNNQLGAGSSAPVPIKDSTSGPVAQENFEGHVQSLAYAEYSQKLSQYYELEEQRQKLLHELNQANYWNYQNYSEGSGSYLPQNAFCAASQSQLPPYHGSYPYCPACSCHCLATSCVVPTCAMGDNCSTINGTHAIATACKADPVGPFSCSKDNIIKAAKEAAEKAISSMKLNTSMTSGISINEGEQLLLFFSPYLGDLNS